MSGSFIYFRMNIIICFILGIMSGLPLALSGSALSTLLREQGIDLATIGLFAMMGVPYSLKFLWAPLLNVIYVPKLSNLIGRRKLQILVMGMLTITAIVLESLLIESGNVSLIAIGGLMIATCSASLDVVIDATRIEMIESQEQAAGAAMANSGYRVAMIISGAGIFAMAHFFGWQMAFLAMAGLQVVLMIVVLLFISEPDFVLERRTFAEHVKVMFWMPLADFLAKPNFIWIVVFIISFKLSDAMLLSLISPFLLDTGFDKLEIAQIVKAYGVGASIIGSFIGGYLSVKMGMRRFLAVGLLLQMTSNLVYIPVYISGHNMQVLVFATTVEYVCSGISSVALVAYISTLCSREFTASQYALFSALATFGRTTIVSASGLMVETFGWITFFVITAAASIPALVLVRKATEFYKNAGKVVEEEV
jgi:PAT family beta-lactamase induction signal transducer AmpG